MAEARERRSARLAMRFPIRVFGTDFKGFDFTEDSSTIVVNLHGAKIRLARQLIPEQEIRIACRRTDQEAVFRVVSQAPGLEGPHGFWGVECLRQGANIWGVSFPTMGAQDQGSVRVMLQCPECRVRELVYLSEPMLRAMEDVGGLVRGCTVCGNSSLWKQVPYFDA